MSKNTTDENIPDAKDKDKFEFIISPETHHTAVNVTSDNYVDIAFTVRNDSGRTVRAEALINPLLPASNRSTDQTAPPELFRRHLRIINPDEWEFDTANTAVRTYIVRLELPDDFPSGSYRFQLLIVGTDDPDNQVVESDVVTITVSGPALSVRPYLLAAAAILAVMILLAVGAALFLRPDTQLKVEFDPPKEMTVGQVATYSITIQNLRQELLNNVMLDYTLPKGLISASAFVPDSLLNNCTGSEGNLHCYLGSLPPDAQVSVTIQALPGPLPGPLPGQPSPQPNTGSRVITHLNSIKITSQLGDKISTQQVDQKPYTSTVKPATQDVSFAIAPAQRVALVDEALNYDILAWSNSPSATGKYTLTYVLPHGLIYKLLPSGCAAPGDYFELVCAGDSIPVAGPEQDMLRIRVQAVASSPNPNLVHTAYLNYEDKTSPVNAVATAVATAAATSTAATITVPKITTTTSAVRTALMFNGVDNWVELDYKKALPTFTAEMWVSPFSTRDDQAFIGAHRRQQDSNNVDNMFLVGYYNDAFSVELNGEYHFLARKKIAGRFHLAVTVEQLQADTWQVIVYINGESQPWQEPEGDGVCSTAGGSPVYCKLFKSPGAKSRLDGEDTLPWVLGQDWDGGQDGPKKSDFFYGSLTEARLWRAARKQDEIQAGMNRRLRGNEKDLEAYWSLEPVDVSSDILVDQASGKYPGKRFKANWEDITPRFGDALAFNGFNDSLQVESLKLSDFARNEGGKGGNTELTMAGWFYVDGVPTRQQWLIGSAAAPVAADNKLDPAKRQDLVGYWRFDEREGAITMPYPGKGQPARLSDGAAFISSAPALTVANPFAMAFNGGKAAVTVESSLPATSVDNFTIAFWINPWASGRVLTIGQDPVSNIICELRDKTILTCSHALDNVTIDLGEHQNQWAHIALQYSVEGQSWRGYLNGNIVENENNNLNPFLPANPTGPLRLGYSNDSSPAFIGLLDELMIFQNLLPPDEIKKLATSAAGDSAPPPASPAPPDPITPTSPLNIWAGLILDNNGHVTAVARPAGATEWTALQDELPIPVGQWVHYAAVIVYDAETGAIDLERLALLRNGGPVKNKPGQVKAGEILVDAGNCAPNFYIGGLCAGGNAYNFSGKIDEVRIWNLALAPAEVDVWRNLPGEVFNEVAYWSFDDILNEVRLEGCGPGQACDSSVTHKHNLDVTGPVWVPAEPNLLQAAIPR